jgi:hypothetical protein
MAVDIGPLQRKMISLAILMARTKTPTTLLEQTFGECHIVLAIDGLAC